MLVILCEQKAWYRREEYATDSVAISKLAASMRGIQPASLRASRVLKINNKDRAQMFGINVERGDQNDSSSSSSESRADIPAPVVEESHSHSPIPEDETERKLASEEKV